MGIAGENMDKKQLRAANSPGNLLEPSFQPDQFHVVSITFK